MKMNSQIEVCKSILRKSEKNGQNNIPRYLYHITNKNNYEKMLKDGFIKMSHDANPETNLEGIFMFDLKNFTQRWLNTGFAIGDEILTLAKALFLNSSSKSSDIVVLKVPTRGLPLDKLKCRTQDITTQISGFHVSNGDMATRQKHYTRKKQPIEYICQETIPMSSVKKIGEADTGVVLEEMIDTSTYTKIDCKQILTNLFKGQAEEKCIKIANKSSIKLKIWGQ